MKSITFWPTTIPLLIIYEARGRLELVPVQIPEEKFEERGLRTNIILLLKVDFDLWPI